MFKEYYCLCHDKYINKASCCCVNKNQYSAGEINSTNLLVYSVYLLVSGKKEKEKSKQGFFKDKKGKRDVQEGKKLLRDFCAPTLGVGAF
jgi:hypothetical protein